MPDGNTPPNNLSPENLSENLSASTPEKAVDAAAGTIFDEQGPNGVRELAAGEALGAVEAARGLTTVDSSVDSSIVENAGPEVIDLQKARVDFEGNVAGAVKQLQSSIEFIRADRAAKGLPPDKGFEIDSDGNEGVIEPEQPAVVAEPPVIAGATENGVWIDSEGNEGIIGPKPPSIESIREGDRELIIRNLSEEEAEETATDQAETQKEKPGEELKIEIDEDALREVRDKRSHGASEAVPAKKIEGQEDRELITEKMSEEESEEMEEGVEQIEGLQTEIATKKQALKEYIASHAAASSTMDQTYLDATNAKIAALELEGKILSEGEVSPEEDQELAVLKQKAEETQKAYEKASAETLVVKERNDKIGGLEREIAAEKNALKEFVGAHMKPYSDVEKFYLKALNAKIVALEFEHALLKNGKTDPESLTELESLQKEMASTEKSYKDTYNAVVNSGSFSAFPQSSTASQGSEQNKGKRSFIGKEFDKIKGVFKEWFG